MICCEEMLGNSGEEEISFNRKRRLTEPSSGTDSHLPRGDGGKRKGKEETMNHNTNDGKEQTNVNDNVCAIIQIQTLKVPNLFETSVIKVVEYSKASISHVHFQTCRLCNIILEQHRKHGAWVLRQQGKRYFPHYCQKRLYLKVSH